MSNPFPICFTARSGSTSLYGTLKNVPAVRMRAEVFGNKELPGGLEQSDDNRIKFLRNYWSPFKDGNRPDVDSHGFKYQVHFKNTQFNQPRRLAKVAKEYSPKIIVAKEILSFFGIEHKDEDVQEAHVKITSDNLRYVVANFDQLKNFCKGTKYEGFV